MKKSLLIFFMGICLSISTLMAAPVRPQVAQQVAEQFLQVSVKSDVADAPARRRIARMAEQKEQDAFYVFETESGGFVIVAADDVAMPVLAYGEKSFVGKEKDMPVQLKEWLNGYKTSITNAVADGVVPSEETKKAWQRLMSNQSQETSVVVAPLISTLWDQAQEYINVKNTYNFYTPEDKITYGDETYTLNVPVGCVATAMAQVMRYWEWPDKGVGSHSYTPESRPDFGVQSANFGATTYQWSKMPRQLTYEGSSDEEIKAVATLMYHCGVAIDMMYNNINAGGSGAYTVLKTDEYRSSYTALRDHFRYKNTMEQVSRDDFSEKTEWTKLMKRELNAGRPIIYSGSGASGGSGHCFVMCGYDSDDKFYFNFGWSGNADGYYTLDAIKPSTGGAGAGSRDYSYGQDAIVNIVPDKNTYVAADYYLLYVSTSSYSNPSLSKTTVQYGNSEQITASMTVKNYSEKSFSGKVALQVINDNDEVVYTTSGKTVSISSSKSLSFTFATNNDMVPGTYRVQPVYENNKGQWLPIDAWHKVNYLRFEVKQEGDINTFGVTFDQISPYRQNSVFSLTVGIANAGQTTYTGKVYMVLLNKDLSVAQRLAEHSFADKPLEHMYYRDVNMSGTITVSPGDYLLGFLYEKDGQEYLLGSSWDKSLYSIEVVAQDAVVASPNLIMQSPLSVKNANNETTIQHYDDIIVSARITNSGDGDYTSGVQFSVYDNQYNVIESSICNIPIFAGMTKEVTYQVDSVLPQGEYTVAVSYLNTESMTYLLIANDYESSVKTFTVNPSPFMLYPQSIQYVETTSTDTYTKGQTVKVQVRMANRGDSDYSGGCIYAYLYNESGEYIERNYYNIDIAAGKDATFTISFSEELAVGKYYVRLWYRETDGYLYPMSEGEYYRYFTIIAAPEDEKNFELTGENPVIIGANNDNTININEQLFMSVKITNSGDVQYQDSVWGVIYDHSFDVVSIVGTKTTIAAGASKTVYISFPDGITKTGAYYLFVSYRKDGELIELETTSDMYAYSYVVAVDPSSYILNVKSITLLNTDSTDYYNDQTPVSARLTIANTGGGDFSGYLKSYIYANSAGYTYAFDSLCTTTYSDLVTIPANSERNVTITFRHSLEANRYEMRVNYFDTETYETQSFLQGVSYYYFTVVKKPNIFILTGEQPQLLNQESDGTIDINDSKQIYFSITNSGEVDYNDSIWVELWDLQTWDITYYGTKMKVSAGKTANGVITIDDELPVGKYDCYMIYSNGGKTDLRTKDGYYAHNGFVVVDRSSYVLAVKSIELLQTESTDTYNDQTPVSVKLTIDNSGAAAYNNEIYAVIYADRGNSYAYDSLCIVTSATAFIAANETNEITMTFDATLTEGKYRVEFRYVTINNTWDSPLGQKYAYFTVVHKEAEPTEYVLTLNDYWIVNSEGGATLYANQGFIFGCNVTNESEEDYNGLIELVIYNKSDSKYVSYCDIENMCLYSKVPADVEFSFADGLPEGEYFAALWYAKSISTTPQYNYVNSFIDITVLGESTPTDNKEAVAAGVSLYPNPATEYVNVVVTGASVITLYDASGKRVMTAQANAAGTERLSLDGLANGYYLVKIAGEDNKVTTLPLIKK